MSSWAKQRQRFGKSVRIWGISLIAAPLLATLAISGPWALPSMAVVIISLNHLSGTMFRSTAASRTDGLTGLANRLTLTRLLSARIARLHVDRSVTLLLIDLNRFKDVNDTYGHLVGDEVLVTLRSGCRRSPGRRTWSPDTAGTSSRSSSVPAPRRRRRLRWPMPLPASLARPMTTAGGVRVVVGGSVGVATTTDPGVDVLGLVEQADRDMYRAKRRQGGAPQGALLVAVPAGPVRSAPVTPESRARRVPSVPLPRPSSSVRNAPVWSMAVQGSAAAPSAGWPGVQWSAHPCRCDLVDADARRTGWVGVTHQGPTDLAATEHAATEHGATDRAVTDQGTTSFSEHGNPMALPLAPHPARVPLVVDRLRAGAAAQLRRAGVVGAGSEPADHRRRSRGRSSCWP